MRPLIVVLGSLVLAGCAARAPQTVSLLGEPLASPSLPREVRNEREAQLAEAEAAVRARPDDVDALIWLGRRTAYLGRYREAVEIYTRALEKHPDEPRLYRHRGHRYITLRQLDLAAADLQRGVSLVRGKPDEVEPDGLPNAKNIPTSTLQSNLWYHLGLALYLQADFEGALAAYKECLAVSGNPDMDVATRHWLYMTLRRLGRITEAEEVVEPVRADVEILENGAYLRLLLMYRKEIQPEELLAAPAEGGESLDPVTLGYGVGNWYLYNGEKKEADKVFRQVLARGQWASFGHIAAEADVLRLGTAPGSPVDL